ncbi:MAG: pilus assembly protein PilM, partial [Candidatus Omnitrophica bacterium]|nr:pilus assembly protein PilM [Candidatus Omnitrophota bacterium]
EMRRNKIESKEAAICLSGKDLIIRTFEIPKLPADELANAINFEAKKYVPFKAEELVADFQVQFDKASRRNLVLYVGIKKETLDKYLTILGQLDVKPSIIEYSSFSVLRFMQSAGIGNKGIVGVISVDFEEEDETHFTILENGFPLFSRDITLMGRPEEAVLGEKPEPAILLEKLKTELHISLDYYDRKLPTKAIERMFLFCPENIRQNLEAAIKETGLAVNFVEVSKYIDRPVPFNLGFIKSYGAALSKIIKTRIKVNLLSVKAKSKTEREATSGARILSVLTDLKISPFVVTLGLFIFAGTFFWGRYRIADLQKEVKGLVSAKFKVVNVNPDSGYEDLQRLDSEYKKKLDVLDSLVKKRLYVTEQLDAIPRVLPDGLWLVDYSFTDDENKTELILKGIAYLGEDDKELKQINAFLSGLKDSTAFSKNFKDISIVSIERTLVDKITASSFTIVCRNDKVRR